MLCDNVRPSIVRGGRFRGSRGSTSDDGLVVVERPQQRRGRSLLRAHLEDATAGQQRDDAREVFRIDDALACAGRHGMASDFRGPSSTRSSPALTRTVTLRPSSRYRTLSQFVSSSTQQSRCTCGCTARRLGRGVRSASLRNDRASAA